MMFQAEGCSGWGKRGENNRICIKVKLFIQTIKYSKYTGSESGLIRNERPYYR